MVVDEGDGNINIITSSSEYKAVNFYTFNLCFFEGCYCQDCNARNAECVRLLLEKGAKTEDADWEGDTPLGIFKISSMTFLTLVTYKC